MSTEVMLKEFAEVAEHPHRVLTAYKNEGKKVIGILPYFAPVELVVAAGMVPMGIWGSNKKTISMAKEYCATFYDTIAQLESEGSQALKEELEAAYEEGVESNG